MTRRARASSLHVLWFVAIFWNLAFLAACGGGNSSTSTNNDVITAAQGTTPQSKQVGQAFQLLQVTVTSGGSPVANVSVTFSAPASGASGTFANGTTTDTETTNNSGVATATTFKANTIAGSYEVTASVSGASAAAKFSLTNTAGSAAAITAAAGSNQSAAAGAAFGATLQAKVVDAFSNPVSGAVVTFTAPNAGASAAFAGATTAYIATATSNSSGVAISPAVTAGGLLGSYTVTATVSGVTAEANFTLTNLTGPAAILTATSGSPQSTIISTPFLKTLQATVTDSFSNPVSGVTVTFTAVPSAGANGTFANGTATDTETTNSDGLAISTAFTANGITGCYSVTASAKGVTGTTSFALTNATTFVHAGIGSLQSATIDTQFAMQMQATVTSQIPASCGAVGPLSGVTVTFTAPASGASGKFADTNSNTTTAITNASGIATAAAFTANNTAGSYTVTASAPAESSPGDFSLTNTAAVSLAPGTYVFRLSGQDNAGNNVEYPYFLAGAFTIGSGASAGMITGGELDFTNYFYADSDSINAATSGISQSSDGNFIITLATCNGQDCSNTDPNAGVDGVITLDAAFQPSSSSTKAFVTEFDSAASGSGTLDFQASTSISQAGYAFGLNGLDTFANPIAIGGVINVNGSGTISGSGSIFDANDDDSGSGFEEATLGASTVTAADSFGRVEFTLNPTDSTDFPQIVLAGYIVDSDHIRLVETIDSYLGDLGGTAFGQGANTGSFSSTSISGTSYVVGLTGSDTAGMLQVVALLTFNPSGTVTGYINYNDLTGLEPQGPSTITGGTYTVDGPTSGLPDAGTGRVTVSGVTDGKITFNLELYLDGNGDAASASLDSSDVIGGLGYQQSGGPFLASMFSGSYAIDATGWDASEFGELDAVGSVTATGSGGTFAGTYDLNWLDLNPSPTEAPDKSVSGTFTSNPDGVFTGTITGLDVTTCSTTCPPVFNYYLIDANGDSIAIETDVNQLTLGYFFKQ